MLSIVVPECVWTRDRIHTALNTAIAKLIVWRTNNPQIGLNHTINHDGHIKTDTATCTTRRPSTTPATGHVTKETRVSHSHKQRPGRQRDSSGKRTQVELTPAAIRPQLPHATMNCKSSFFFFFWFCFCFYIDYLYKQYTNWLPHDKLTTTTSSRNSNGNRTPATAGTTVTRIPAAEAAAEVVAAAAAATNHRCVFFFSSLFFFTTNI